MGNLSEEKHFLHFIVPKISQCLAATHMAHPALVARWKPSEGCISSGFRQVSPGSFGLTCDYVERKMTLDEV